MLEEFQRIGRSLFQEGIVSSHGGNLSVRVGDRILITRRGSMLGHLKEGDVVETGVESDDWGITLASSEIGVHRAIYRATSGLAIVHAHPPHAVALSLLQDEIIPVDSEASYLLHRVPVVATEHTVGSAEVEKVVPQALQEYKIVMLRGHGSFAIGQFLEEAYQWTSVLETAARIIAILRGLGGEVKEYRRGSGEYRRW
ncbi:MAG: aldolase [Acetobacteraceae bacterium]|nr:aldolase [Acetobacteraceae bacterium]